MNEGSGARVGGYAGAVSGPDRITGPWGERTPYARGERWPARVDLCLQDGIDEAAVDDWAQAASTLHSNGDGIDVAVRDGRIVGVRGRAGDRVNRGRLDPKDCYGRTNVSGSGPNRCPRSSSPICASSRLERWKSKTSMFSSMRRGVTDFGKTT